MRTVWRTVDFASGGLNVRAKALKNNIADITDGADAKFPIGIAYSFCIPAWSMICLNMSISLVTRAQAASAPCRRT